MKFDSDKGNDEFTTQPTTNNQSQWRKITKVITNEENMVFKKMVKTISTRGENNEINKRLKKPITSSSSRKFKWFKTNKDVHTPNSIIDKSVKNKSESPENTPLSVVTVNFNSYLESFKKMIDRKDVPKRKIKRSKIVVRQAPGIFVSKFTKKFSSSKIISTSATFPEYEPGKFYDQLSLASVQEGDGIKECSSKASFETNRSKSVRKRLFSAKICDRKFIGNYDELQEAKIS
jgi:predicted HNH restriction endonuclease